MLEANKKEPTPGPLLIGSRCQRAEALYPGLLAGIRELLWTLLPPEVTHLEKSRVETLRGTVFQIGLLSPHGSTPGFLNVNQNPALI